MPLLITSHKVTDFYGHIIIPQVSKFSNGVS